MLRMTLPRLILNVLCLGIVLTQVACDKDTAQPARAPTAQDTIDISENGRFQLVSGPDGIALDTRTGMFCSTTIRSSNGKMPFCLDLLVDGDNAVKQIMAERKMGASTNAPNSGSGAGTQQ